MRNIEVALVRVPEEKGDNTGGNDNKRGKNRVFREKFATLLDIAGGLSFVEKGESVLIKTSINPSRIHPSAADPMVVSSLLELLARRKPGAIYVGDKGSLFKRNSISLEGTDIGRGVEKVVRNFPNIPVKIVAFNDYIFRNRYFSDDIEKNWEIRPDEYFIRAPKMLFETDPILRDKGYPPKVDHIIILKTVIPHSLGRFSMGMKSYVGFLDRESRCLLHMIPHKNNLRLNTRLRHNKEHVQSRIPELFTVIPHPKLVILDGRDIIVNGKPRDSKSGVIIAGSDVVATDSVGVSLLKSSKGVSSEIRKFPLWDMPTFHRAEELGIGATRKDKILLHTDEEEEIFEKMAWYIQ